MSFRTFSLQSLLNNSKQGEDHILPVDLLISSSVIPSGLQQEGNTKIRIEPGLFEWTKWVSGTGLPTWIPPAELAAVKLSVDTTYRYTYAHAGLFLPPSHAEMLRIPCWQLSAMTFEPVKTVLCGFVSRPHIPISKLVLSESYDTYISRSFQVTREILAECKNQGKGSR